MANCFVFLCVCVLVTMVYGMEKSTIGKVITQRSDILVHDVVQQMVAEQIERHKILEKFSDMKNELNDVKRELKTRNTLMRDTKFLQKKLLREVKHMKEEVKQASAAEVKKEISGFKQKMLAMTKKLWKNMKLLEKTSKAEMSDTKKEIGEMKMKSSKELKSTNKAITDLLNRTSDSGQQVAFTAALKTHTAISSVIVFNKVVTNVGGGYNNSDGMFHCPRSGLYLFSTTLTAYNIPYVVGYLMQNHNKVARAHENSGNKAYPSASLTAVLKVNTGDKIWIKGYEGVKYYGTDNVFTGVLIKP